MKPTEAAACHTHTHSHTLKETKKLVGVLPPPPTRKHASDDIMDQIEGPSDAWYDREPFIRIYISLGSL